MISGQLLPDAGAVRIAGVDVVADPNGARAKVGYVPEEPRLYDYLSAREMLSFVAEIRGVGSAEVDAALELCGLGGDADRLIREYSQGMRRRAALGCAMVAKPPLLVLDESLNGLDPPSAERTLRGLRAACAAGAGVVLSTHVLDTLERVADRIVMIRGGIVIADVPASELGRLRGAFEDGTPTG
jgi:ABC-2 type transport system ATP-binding protein